MDNQNTENQPTSNQTNVPQTSAEPSSQPEQPNNAKKPSFIRRLFSSPLKITLFAVFIAAIIIGCVAYFNVFHNSDTQSASTSIECPASSITTSVNSPTTSTSNLPIVVPSKINLPPPTQGINIDVRTALNNSLKYNLVTWFNTCFGSQKGLITPNGNGEIPVRSEATVAYSTAIALKSGGFTASTVGISNSEAISRAKRLLMGVAMTQKANAGANGWGHNWQSAYWAFFDGTAGWLMQSDLTTAERQAVAKMVADEADFQVSQPSFGGVAYMTDSNGNVLTPGNTRADEDSWNATILGLAAMMMPNDSRAPSWRRLEAQYQIAAYSRPNDLTNKEIVNGKTVSSWLNGSNINNDGTLVNHNRLHPGYMSGNTTNLNGILTAGLAGKPGLNTALWNSDLVYSAISSKKFTSPPWQAPGGTIYKQGSGLIYYPQGNDWGTTGVANYAAFDAMAGSLGFGASNNARSWFGLHLDRQLQLQDRFVDGRTFAGLSTDTNAENTYAGREQVVSGQLAQTWLNQYLAYNNSLSTTNASLQSKN